MKGYKAFDKEWTCRGKQYKVGETFEEDVQLIPCKSGMHFCDRMPNVFRYYTYDPGTTVVAEVEALGDVKTDDGIKFCTNKLRIIREISWDEVQKACNTGDRNTGNWNTGDRNTGDRNTGDWNKSSFNNGCFMTSVDTGRETYLEEKQKFKNKWLDMPRKDRIKKTIDTVLTGARKELYETYGIKEDANNDT